MAVSNSDNNTIPYTVTIRGRNPLAVHAMSILLLLIFMLAFFRYWVYQRMGEYWLLLIPAMILVLAFNGFLRRKQPDFVIHFRTELKIAAMAAVFLPLVPYSWVFGIGLFAMSMLDRWVTRPDEFYFSDEGIERNSFPRKKIDWVAVENVMVRNGLFTLDLRSNKLIQQPLDEPVSEETENEFNAWCRERLHFAS